MRPRVSCWAWLPVFVVLNTSTQADEPIHYSIELNDKVIGYAVITSQSARHGDRPVTKVTSETLLKVALLGKERRTLLNAKTWFQPGTSTPLEYKQTSTVNDVVGQLESNFEDGTVRTWSYRQGRDKGEPVQTSLPAGCFVLGGNNFGHWRQLMKHVAQQSDDRQVTVPVYVPDSRQLQSLQFVRGPIRQVEVSGTSRECVQWRLEVANMSLYVDAASGEFVKMELPAQQTSITLADANTDKLAQKAQAEEVLARHFKQIETGFDDYMKVSYLKAEVDVQVIGESASNPESILTTVMQDFSGRKEQDRITGEFVVRSRQYDGADAPPFPSSESAGNELDAWLAASTFIECEDPEIAGKAAELVQGAKTRWDATLRVCRWVEREIRYEIADTPSARLALDKKSGDCGPHSTLSVALLRASGIPAKLVGGLLYTPTFGGSFGQHAWIEVYMGSDGWIPLDPTTGEFESINATHIKLFEGLGGVLPQTVQVVAFEPPNRSVETGQLAPAKSLPWKLGKSYAFAYTQGGQSLGKETFRFERVQHQGEDALKLHSSLNLKVGGVAVGGTTEFIVSPAARPRYFKRELDLAGRELIIDCKFGEQSVDVKQSGAASLNRDVQLQPGDFCFDNNLMSSFVLICSQLDYEVGKTVNVRTFHPQSTGLIPLSLRVKSLQTVTVSGHELECYECEVQPIKNTFWITKARQFVKAQQGGLVIELTALK